MERRSNDQLVKTDAYRTKVGFGGAGIVAAIVGLLVLGLLLAQGYSDGNLEIVDGPKAGIATAITVFAVILVVIAVRRRR